MTSRLGLLFLVAGVIACGASNGGNPLLDGDATPPDSTQVELPVPDADPSLATALFRASDDEVPNPDRGFYAYVDDLTVLTEDALADVYADGVRLVYTPIRLDAARGRALDASELAAIEYGLGLVRDAGLGLILRFTYNYPESETDYRDARDASLEQVRAHIAALAPIIEANADIITFWQAGFIGAWGEWHSSSNGLDSDAGKLAVRDALLAALPRYSYLQVRYPPDLARWLPPPPTRAPAPLDRIGFHNDCFMSSDDDVGTFEGGLTDPLRAFVAELGAIAPMGGETCDAAAASEQRRGCADILAEGPRYQVTYLNRDYHTAFHDRWRAEGCFDEVRRRLGYRLELRSVSHSASIDRGGLLSLSLVIENTGWARPFTRHNLYLMLVGPDREYAIATRMNAHTFMPGAQVEDAALPLPEDIPSGTYRVGLAWRRPGLIDARRTLRFAVADDIDAGQLWQGDVLTTGTSLVIR